MSREHYHRPPVVVHGFGLSTGYAFGMITAPHPTEAGRDVARST